MFAAEPPPAEQNAAWRTSYLLTRAGDAFALGRFDEAEQLFKSLIKQDPTNEIALIHLAAICNKRKDAQSAAAYLQTLVKAHPESFAGQHELGIAYLVLARPRDAVAPLVAATELDAKSLPARLNLGDVYLRLQRYGDAASAFESALALEPTHPLALRQAGYAAFRSGEPQRALGHLQRARAVLPADWTVAMTLGHTLAALGNDASALEAYEAVVRLAPSQSSGNVFAGNMLERMNRLKEAEKRYRDALRIDTRDTLARVHLGNLMRKDGRTDQARREYEAALRIDPKQVWALTQLAFLLFELQDLKRAEKMLGRALLLAPRDDELEATLGDLLAMTNRKRDAVVRFRRVLGRNPNHLGSLIRLGSVLESEKKNEEALALYERAVRQHPRSAWAKISLGDLLRKLGRPAIARDLYQQALEDDPRSAWAKRQLGYVLFDLGDYDASERALTEVSAAYPQEGALALVLGHCARLKGRNAEALARYERAALLDRKDARAQMFIGVMLGLRDEEAASVAAFERALEIDPKLYEGLVLLGDMATRARASALGPASNPASQPASMVSFVKASDPDLAERFVKTARDAYTRAISLSAGASWPTRQLGYLEFLAGDGEKADQLLSRVEGEFPDDVEIPLIRGHQARVRKDLVAARAHYERAKKVAPNDVRTIVFLAIAERDNHELERAYDLLIDASVIAPLEAWAHYERAVTLVELGRSPQAILAAERATQLDPNMRDAWLLLGRLHHLARHHEAAVEAYAKASLLDPAYAPGQVGYASALLYRDRTGDIGEAAARISRTLLKLENDAFAELVAGHVFARMVAHQNKGTSFAYVLDKLSGPDAGKTAEAIAVTHLTRAVQLADTDLSLRLSVATSLVLLKKGPLALHTLEPLLRRGAPLCPKKPWDVTWKLEGKTAEALLAPQSIEENQLLKTPDLTAIAYMLAGDIALQKGDRAEARLRYACATALQPTRPEAHLQLGFAYENDAFYRLAEAHYLLARRLSVLALPEADRPRKDRFLDEPASRPSSAPSSAPVFSDPPPRVDVRVAELQKFASVADEAVGRLRKEAGIPLTSWLRASAETNFVSDSQGAELVARLATLLSASGQNPDLALTVPRTFSTMAALSAKPSAWQTLPRFELQYRFFREEGTFWNDRQTVEPRLGHVVQLGAYGVVPLRIAETELRYSAEEKVTYADSTSRQEVRLTTTLKGHLSHFRFGSALTEVGYEIGFFIPRDLSVLLLGLPPDVRAHTFFFSGRIEPQLRRFLIDVALTYRTDQVWLEPSNRNVSSHALTLDVGGRIKAWSLAGTLRFGFASTNYVPEAVPTVFSYLVRFRGGRLFNDVGNVGAFVGIAGTGTNFRYDYVSAGVDGSYRLAWPKIPGRVHTGFYGYASYELRVAYNIARFDHLVSVGLSFAR